MTKHGFLSTGNTDTANHNQYRRHQMTSGISNFPDDMHETILSEDSPACQFIFGPKNELAGGGIFGENRLVHVIRKITDARSHLVASVLIMIGGVGVAGAEESVLGHWLFAKSQ